MSGPYRPRRRLAPDAAAFVAQLREGDRARPGVVLDELRRVILAGGAGPGLPIPADEVGAVFGVSVIPVREALQTLVGEGLVEHEPRGAYTVARLTATELRELYLVRGVLEQAALAAAATRADPADHDRAREAHEALERALRDDDDPAYHRESRRFHLALVAPAGMHRLQAMLESAWNVTEPYRPMAQVPSIERADLHREHGLMLAAFVERDTPALLAEAARHHDHLRKAIEAQFSEQEPPL